MCIIPRGPGSHPRECKNRSLRMMRASRFWYDQEKNPDEHEHGTCSGCPLNWGHMGTCAIEFTSNKGSRRAAIAAADSMKVSTTKKRNTFKINTRVRHQFNDGGKDGRITKTNRGTYCVQFDNGDLLKNIKEEELVVMVEEDVEDDAAKYEEGVRNVEVLMKKLDEHDYDLFTATAEHDADVATHGVALRCVTKARESYLDAQEHNRVAKEVIWEKQCAYVEYIDATAFDLNSNEYEKELEDAQDAQRVAAAAESESADMLDVVVMGAYSAHSKSKHSRDLVNVERTARDACTAALLRARALITPPTPRMSYSMSHQMIE